MRKIRLFCLGFLALIANDFAIADEIKAGVPAYWGSQGDYSIIPEGGLAVLNPNSGILDESKQTLDIAPNAAFFRGVVAELKANDVDVYAYVPTGYFNHECNEYGKCQTWERIVTQIFAYTELYPEISGFFFDEASGENKNCADFKLEYARLRGLVQRYKEDANIIFNPGWSNPCVVEASLRGEIVLTFEGARSNYSEYKETTQSVIDMAKEKGVKTWHLVHTARGKDTLKQVVKEARDFGVDYLYVTDIGGNWQAGENTWGSAPKYWSTQKKLLTEQLP